MSLAAGDAPMPQAGRAQALKAQRQKGARAGSGGWNDADRRAMQDTFQSGRQSLAAETTFKCTKPDGTVYEATTRHKYSEKSTTRCADKAEELRMEELSVKGQKLNAWKERQEAQLSNEQPPAERTEAQLAKAARRREKKAAKAAATKEKLDRLDLIEKAEEAAKAAAAQARQEVLEGLFRQALSLISERVGRLAPSRGRGIRQHRAAFELGEEELPVVVPDGGAAADMLPEDVGRGIVAKLESLGDPSELAAACDAIVESMFVS
jgi:hypothetical protein